MKGFSERTPRGDAHKKTYTFNKKYIVVEYAGESYSGYSVSMNFIEDEKNYYVTEITLRK